MHLLHIIGRKNHGKTTLIVELVAQCAHRGLRVGTIKHSSHVHELDTPGTDSYRHRAAGAAPAAIVTRDSIGVFMPKGEEADFYRRLAPWYAGCDLVLVEGDLHGPGIKIEVWRRAAGGHCLAAEHAEIRAIITDDPVETALPLWPRSDIQQIVDRMLDLR